VRHAGEHAPQFAQGIAFAAEARRRAGNLAPQTELACKTVWGLDAARVSQIVVGVSEGLPRDIGDTAEPAYEVWRRRIQEQFTERM
jgi:hypothetical protein